MTERREKEGSFRKKKIFLVIPRRKISLTEEKRTISEAFIYAYTNFTLQYDSININH